MFASIMSVMLGLLFHGNPSYTYTLPTYEVPLASVSVPTQCQGHTYTHAFSAPADSLVTGTSGPDIIYAGQDSIIHGGAGNDCIVITTLTSAYGDDGNDILVSQADDNYLDGGNGIDTAYYFKATDATKHIENLVAQ